MAAGSRPFFCILLTAYCFTVYCCKMTSSAQDLLRLIPAVDQFLLRPKIVDWVDRTSRGFVVSEIQLLLREVRSGIQSGDPGWSSTAEISSLESLLEARLESRLLPALRPVINGTGVILHTNLGRAPLSKAAQQLLIRTVRPIYQS